MLAYLLLPCRKKTVPGVFFCGRTELTEVSGSGIEAVPNLARVLGRVLRPYRTLSKTSVGYLPIANTPAILWYVPCLEHTLLVVAFWWNLVMASGCLFVVAER